MTPRHVAPTLFPDMAPSVARRGFLLDTAALISVQAKIPGF